MNLFIGLVAPGRSLCEEFESQQDRLIPKELVLKNEIVRQLNANFMLGAYDTSARERKLSLEDYLIRATRKADAVILIVDRTRMIPNALRTSLFSAFVDLPDKFNFQNFFAPIITRLLRNFASLWSLMNRADNEQAMILPLRNFTAAELRDLAVICRDDTMTGDFHNLIGPKVTSLKRRRKPRRKSNFAALYFVDDNERFFIFGKEEHAQLSTGAPHTVMCEITGNFRFGKRISVRRHFNVMDGTEGAEISGTFPDCHDEPISVPSRSHLNMFSNDQH